MLVGWMKKINHIEVSSKKHIRIIANNILDTVWQEKKYSYGLIFLLPLSMLHAHFGVAKETG